MSNVVYRYVFEPRTPIEEIEATLLLAILAAESLHGEAQVQLDVAHYLDRGSRACVIGSDSEVGRDLNRLFIGYVLREFGAEAFKVDRIEKSQEADICP